MSLSLPYVTEINKRPLHKVSEIFGKRFFMEETWETLENPWERLKWARVRWQRDNALKPSLAKAAKHVGMSESGYSQYERSPDSSRNAKLRNYAELFGGKFGVSWLWLLNGTGTPFDGVNHVPDIPNTNHFQSSVKGVEKNGRLGSGASDVRWIPVAGKVQAGAWTVVDDFEFVDENAEELPFSDPRYARATVRCLLVQGNSCNKKYKEGTRVFVVPAAEKGIRENNFVIVRQFDITGKAETTIKQVVSNNGVIELWPRSTDPRYQEPIIMKPRDIDSQEGPDIWAVVVGAYEPEDEGGPMLEI